MPLETPFNWSADFVLNNARVHLDVKSSHLNPEAYVSFTGDINGGAGQIVDTLRSEAATVAPTTDYLDDLVTICDAWDALHLKRFDDLGEDQLEALEGVRSALLMVNGERFGTPGDLEEIEDADFSNADNTLDSRDIIKRIETLKGAFEAAGLDPAKLIPSSPDYDAQGLAEDDPAHDFAKELKHLLDLESEGESYGGDWSYGATLIRDSYFEDYAKELAEDIGAMPKDAAWPCQFIDWTAATEALKMDYTEVDFDGVAYWIR